MTHRGPLQPLKFCDSVILNMHATLVSHLIEDGAELEKLQQRATRMIRNKK